MPSRLHFLLASLASAAVGQLCSCPVVPDTTATATSTLVCPAAGDIFTATSINNVGACRNTAITTTTVTRTAGQCYCLTGATETETATPDCPGVTSTSTVVRRTIDCPYASTATQTITRYGSSNSSTYPTTGGSAASSGFLPTGTISLPAGTAVSPPHPTCFLSGLPDNFYIRNAATGWYLLHDPYSGTVVGCPKKEDATAFHFGKTDESDLSGVPQLSLYSRSSTYSDNEEYGAYVQYDGGPMRFFRADNVPEEGDWFTVTAGFSSYLCQLSLITFNLHDLSTPQICAGYYYSLGYGFGEDKCPEVDLTVETA